MMGLISDVKRMPVERSARNIKLGTVRFIGKVADEHVFRIDVRRPGNVHDPLASASDDQVVTGDELTAGHIVGSHTSFTDVEPAAGREFSAALEQMADGSVSNVEIRTADVNVSSPGDFHFTARAAHTDIQSNVRFIEINISGRKFQISGRAVTDEDLIAERGISRDLQRAGSGVRAFLNVSDVDLIAERIRSSGDFQRAVRTVRRGDQDRFREIGSSA